MRIGSTARYSQNQLEEPAARSPPVQHWKMSWCLFEETDRNGGFLILKDHVAIGVLGFLYHQ